MIRTRHTGKIRCQFVDNSTWRCFNGSMNKQTRDSRREPRSFYFYNSLPNIPGGCVMSKRGYIGSPRRLLTVPYYSPCSRMDLFINYEIVHGRVALEPESMLVSRLEWQLHSPDSTMVKCCAIELTSSKDASKRYGFLKFGPICPSENPMWGMFQSRSRHGNKNDDCKMIAPMKIT